MNSINHKRKENNLFRALSQIICEEINNANISLPTVTEVRLSNDQSILKVFVAFNSHEEKSLENLKRTIPFIIKRLEATQLLRKIPRINLILDKSFEEAKKIEEILRKIKEKKNK